MALEWRGEEVKAIIKEATGDGLLKAAEHLLAEAKKVVPIEEATLERSGVASVDEGKGQAAVSFGTAYLGGSTA